MALPVLGDAGLHARLVGVGLARLHRRGESQVHSATWGDARRRSDGAGRGFCYPGDGLVWCPGLCGLAPACGRHLGFVLILSVSLPSISVVQALDTFARYPRRN